MCIKRKIGIKIRTQLQARLNQSEVFFNVYRDAADPQKGSELLRTDYQMGVMLTEKLEVIDFGWLCDIDSVEACRRQDGHRDAMLYFCVRISVRRE